MGPPVLSLPARSNVAFTMAAGDATWFGKSSHARDVSGGDVLRVTGVPIFRSGTFRDSYGIQHTWEKLHIQQLVANFRYLRETGIFRNVPLRAGHEGLFEGGMGHLIGYFDDLRVEDFENPVSGKKESYVIGDFTVSDEAAAKNISGGFWRERSAEIGHFTSNDEAEYWPVLCGAAYVDVGAVEGLNLFQRRSGSDFSVLSDSQEVPVGPTPADPPAIPTPALPPIEPVVHSGGPPNPATPPAAAPPRAAPLVFRVAGQDVSDSAQVQRHIETLERNTATLEAFRTETLQAARKNFVRSLAASNKVNASEIDSMEEFALSLDDAQYVKWVATFEKAPALAHLGRQAPDGAQNGGPAALSADQQTIADLEETLKYHRMGGMSEEDIKRTASFAKLAVLQARKD